MSGAVEPSLATLPQPWLRYFAATRPAFLSVTFVACVLGLACAAAPTGGGVNGLSALVTVVFALLAHAGANVVNDFHDAINGGDAINEHRIYPFTGGSRVIQNGVISLRACGRFGHLLLALVIPAGLWLTWVSAPPLLLIGAAGLLIGWAYSAPPLQLQARGLGEFGVTAAWLLVVVGADFVQRRHFAATPLAAGLGYALLVANVLFINQFPDVRADALSGKRTVVVRLGARRARWGYILVAAAAHACTAAMIAIGELPPAALLALLSAVGSVLAGHGLWRDALQPQRLTTAIRLTIAAAVSHGLLLAAVLLFAS